MDSRSIKRYLLIIGIWLLCLPTYAQFNSNLGRFQVDVIKGCAPLDINITNLIPANCPCDVRFGDGTTGQNTFTHTYTTPGIYTLEIDYQSLNPRTDVITIEVVDNVPPDFNILKCSANQATIEIVDNNYDQYFVDFDNDGVAENIVNQGNPIPPHTYPGTANFTIGVKGINLVAADNCVTNTKTIATVPVLPPPDINSIDLVGTQSIDIGFTPQPDIVNRLEIATNGTGAFQVLATLDNTTNTFNLSNGSIDTENNYYCFRLGSYDACNNTSTYSDIVCTIDLELQINDGKNDLSWNNAPGVTSYSICKNGTCGISLPGNTFEDSDIICGTDYCYQVIATYSNGAVSTSHEYCGTAFSTATPDRIDNLITEVNQGRVDIEWAEPVAFSPDEYTLNAGLNGEPLELLDNFTVGPYADRPTNQTKPTCYQLFYRDVCGNSSPIPTPICTMHLNATVQIDNSVQLNWNEYTGYENGVDFYRIEKYDQAGFLQATYTSTTSDFFDGNDITVFQIARYKVFAVPNDNFLTESYSNEARIIKQSFVSHPEAFTPNGDGLNDEFILYASYVKTFRLNIFNRWGELIFSANRLGEGWDGTYNGKLMPSGSYSYSAEITDLANRSYQLSGFFALIRN